MVKKSLERVNTLHRVVGALTLHHTSLDDDVIIAQLAQATRQLTQAASDLEAAARELGASI